MIWAEIVGRDENDTRHDVTAHRDLALRKTKRTVSFMAVFPIYTDLRTFESFRDCFRRAIVAAFNILRDPAILLVQNRSYSQTRGASTFSPRPAHLHSPRAPANPFDSQ